MADEISEALNKKPLDEVTPEDYLKIEERLNPLKKYGTEYPAHKWEFEYLKRDENGRFKDEDLAKIIKECVEAPAHAFGTCRSCGLISRVPNMLLPFLLLLECNTLSRAQNY